MHSVCPLYVAKCSGARRFLSTEFDNSVNVKNGHKTEDRQTEHLSFYIADILSLIERLQLARRCNYDAHCIMKGQRSAYS